MNDSIQLAPQKLTKTGEAHHQTAVLIVAHGSRRPTANDDILQLAQLVSERGGYCIVETAYLEIAQPSVPIGVRRCVDRGATRVLIFPYFLSAGVHVVNDFDDFRIQFEKEYPDVEFVVCPHLGLHPLMVEIVLARLKESTNA